MPADPLPPDPLAPASGIPPVAVAQIPPTGEEAAFPTPEEEVDDIKVPPPSILAKLPVYVLTFVRTTFTFQRPGNAEKMDKWIPDIILGAIFYGRVHELFGVTTGIIGRARPKQSTSIDDITTGKLVDFLAVAQFEPHPWFNVWLGHLQVPSDRSSVSSLFFMSPWRFPGESAPGRPLIAPKTGTFAGISASNGGTIWGDLGQGKLKYYLGSYIQDPSGDPVISARMQYNLLGAEPGYKQRSHYHGKQGDILSVGASLQSQRNGSAFYDPTRDYNIRSDYRGGNIDLLFEKKLGSLVIDLEGAAYLYQGKYEEHDYSWFGLISCVLPGKLWIGRFEPLFRYQQFHLKASDTRAEAQYRVYDVQLNYMIKGDYIRAAVGYTRHQNEILPGNSVFLGLQLMK